MNRAARSSKPAASRLAPMLTGLIFGVLLGLLMAAAVAWYILTRNPQSFVAETPPPKPQPLQPAAPASMPQPASSVGESKPRFEFYKVLDGKADSAPPAPAPKAVAPAPSVPGTPAATAKKGGGQLQVGAFQHQEDAEKQKAKLALLGLEAHIETAQVAEGTRYRVRLGPYASREDMDSALAVLKQNGMSAMPVSGQ